MAEFLVHREGDHVGVAVKDIKKGQTTEVLAMDTGGVTTVEVRDDIPLGHKVALADLAEGAQVIEYGDVIGVTSRPVKKGDWVHVHNIRSARW